MRTLWTLAKVVLALCIGIPLAIIALSLTLGLMGAVFGLAVLTLRIALIGLVGYGVYRLARALFGGRSGPAPRAPSLPPPDPYLESAKRELDRELGVR